MTYLDELHASLDQRWRPEDVFAAFPSAVRAEIGHAGPRTLIHSYWTSMTSDFARPVDATQVLASVERAFGHPLPPVDPADPADVRRVATALGEPLGWQPAERDKHLTRAERAAQGIELSRRQYNRQWRALRRLNRKASRLSGQQEQRALIIVGHSGFVFRITRDRFAADPAAAHFIAYWVARKNQRRMFTLAAKINPMDEVAAQLLARCEAAPGTDWEMIAWARPTADVLGHLTEEQKGRLMADWVGLMRRCADILETVWDPKIDRREMIVRRGQDSSTWNEVAQAYNAARSAWIGCLASLGALDLLGPACPGKVMRLMAADLAYWHRSTGGGVDPNTLVWAALPLPWEVLNGGATCTAELVARECRMARLDPHTSGWLGPKPQGQPVPFEPTPELVHGVAIADPLWAGLLRRAGVFSGKKLTDDPELRAAAVRGLVGGVVTSDLPSARPNV